MMRAIASRPASASRCPAPRGQPNLPVKLPARDPLTWRNDLPSLVRILGAQSTEHFEEGHAVVHEQDVKFFCGFIVGFRLRGFFFRHGFAATGAGSVKPLLRHSSPASCL